jgi:signal recognition particle subunit SEC65
MNLYENIRNHRRLNEANTKLEETPEFIAVLSKHLRNPNDKSIAALAKYKDQISPEFRIPPKELYRGMSLPNDVIDNLRKTGIKFKKPRSWTTYLDTAKGFALPPPHEEKDHSGIILTYKAKKKDIIMNIRDFVHSYDRKVIEDLGYGSTVSIMLMEDEVVLDAGIKAEVSDIKVEFFDE